MAIPVRPAANQAAKKKQQDKKRNDKNDNGKDDDLDARALAREYGFGWRFFKQDPELWKLLQEAVANTWSDKRFEMKFKATDWYKQHSDTYRQAMGLKFSDPGAFKDRINESRARVENMAGQWGADLTPKELERYARRAFLFGWNDAQLMDFLAKEVRPDKTGSFDGELAGIEQSLRKVAYANGVNINQKQLTNWMRQIVRGHSDMREYETYIRKQAAATFSAFSKEILSGMDAMDIASPYIQAMSNILEINPATIGLDDKTIRRALGGMKNQKDGSFEPLSLTDFEDQLRADPRWQYTDGARDLMKGYAIELGKMWGVLS